MYNQFNSYNFNNDMYYNISKIRYMEKDGKVYLAIVDISKLITNNISYLTSRYKSFLNTKRKIEAIVNENPEMLNLINDIEFKKIPLSDKNKSNKREKNSKLLKMFNKDLILFLLTGEYKDKTYKIYRLKNETDLNARKDLIVELIKSDNLIDKIEESKTKIKIDFSSEDLYSGLAKLDKYYKDLLLNEDRKYEYEEIFFKLIVENDKIGKITYNDNGMNCTFYSIVDICRFFNLSDTYRINRSKNISDTNYIILAIKKHGGKKTMFINIEGLCEFFNNKKNRKDYHASISGELTRLLYVLCLRNKDNPLFI